MSWSPPSIGPRFLLGPLFYSEICSSYSFKCSRHNADTFSLAFHFSVSFQKLIGPRCSSAWHQKQSGSAILSSGFIPVPAPPRLLIWATTMSPGVPRQFGLQHGCRFSHSRYFLSLPGRLRFLWFGGLGSGFILQTHKRCALLPCAHSPRCRPRQSTSLLKIKLISFSSFRFPRQLLQIQPHAIRVSQGHALPSPIPLKIRHHLGPLPLGHALSGNVF